MFALVDGTISECTQEKIYFLLTDWIEPRSPKKKSVVAHSIRVGLRLAAGGTSEDVIVAGFLHDVLENSAVTKKMLAQEFGKYVAEIVVANTIDKRVMSGLPGYRDSVVRCAAIGRDALLVRAVDMLDNFERHYRNNPMRHHERYTNKLAILQSVADAVLVDETLYQTLVQRIWTTPQYPTGASLIEPRKNRLR